MKGSLTSASAIVKGFKGWIARRRAAATAKIETPETEVVWVCGRRMPMEGPEFDARREFSAQQDRWPLGPSVDNYS
ncbi:hypothetical protein HYPDE_24848 [Hyphomicrobium denitrificans 1NES1]|uniref:Uncharacterized protein n=1 Tax=Hyphomicrobium denitrificans 1NES1 TaxID=670307 RepID=N0AZQ9_9HYPH|nr:hypothetical protein [Hyphomicrobium denitrificans]AGK56654.1 hypothetical protein HYPDE_24848 [Hyphomicrobium denitrificans 1NES1]